MTFFWGIPPIYDKPPLGKFLRNWVKDNALHPDQPCHPNTYLFMPWVPCFPIDWTLNMPFWQSQLLSAQKIFGLCGKIWYDRTLALEDDSLESQVKHKLVHINMGVSAQNIKPQKTSFNAIGDRGILHISNLQTYKGFETTCMSVMGLDVLLHVAGHVPEIPEGMVRTTVQGQEFIFNFLGAIDNSDPFTNQWIVENVETIEHIPDQLTLPNFCDRNHINHVILTYPSKKTTHYNPFHLYDFKLQDILNIFAKFICYKHFNWEYEFDVVFLLRESQ